MAVRSKDGKKMRKKDQPHLTRNAKKALKETKAIEAEMKEAEAEVDREERASQVCCQFQTLVISNAFLSTPKH